jgi:ferredoxin-NADP reductase
VPPPPTFEARLVAARALTPSVRELTFERVDGAPLAFEAGQWVSLVLPKSASKDGVTELRRSYSLASEPNGTGRFDLAITRVATGAGSPWLHAMPVGETLTAVGPQGFFTRGRSAGASLFVATGTGVTPFRSMLRAASANGDATPTWLLFGVRHEVDALYRDELEAMAEEHPHVKLAVTLSQPHEGWSGRRGYVQHHVRELHDALAAEGAAPHVYICGLQRMVGSVRELLRGEMQLPRERVHSERYD